MGSRDSVSSIGGFVGNLRSRGSVPNYIFMHNSQHVAAQLVDKHSRLSQFDASGCSHYILKTS